MSDKNINIHVKAEDTDQTKSKVDAVGTSIDNLGDKIRKTKDHTESAGKSTENFSEKVKKTKDNTDIAGKSQENFNEKIKKSKEAAEKAGDSQEELGEKTRKGQKKAGDETEKTSNKMTFQEKILGSLKNQVTGFIVATLGIQAVSRLADAIISKFERIAELMRSTYEKGVGLTETGQALEFQTGTTGKQKEWALKAAELQKAGALPNIDIAKQMMISADIAFAAQGGIKNPEIMEMLKNLAPFAGTAQLGSDEITKLFEFAGAAGIAPNVKAYKDYFAKMQAGFTASKATSFGEFTTGLQKGATSYLSMGGSLEEAISAYAAARAVTANESLAASLLEQVTRLSGGAYEKPRKDIEKKMKVKWKDLVMDDRLAVLLQYVENLSENERTQKLTEAGFPVELTTQLGKIVSPEAKKTLAATRESVRSADAEKLTKQTDAYINSPLGKERSQQAEETGSVIAETDKIADWNRRIEKAKYQAERDIRYGNDRTIVRDKHEDLYIALDEMIKELEPIIKANPTDWVYGGGLPPSNQAEQLYTELRDDRTRLMIPGLATYYDAKVRATKGYEYEQRLGQIRRKVELESIQPGQLTTITDPNILQQAPWLGSQPWEQPQPEKPWEKPETVSPAYGPVIINNHYDNSLNLRPTTDPIELNRVTFNE